MPETALVVDQDGVRGTLLRRDLDEPGEAPVLIRLDDGDGVLIDRDLLEPLDDDGYSLPLRFATLLDVQRGEEIVVPVIEEAVAVEKHDVVRGKVRLSKVVSEREVLVDQPLLEEHVEVNRVVVNRFVDEAPEIRHEGDIMIIPVLEEVVVVEVRLMVREEIHVARRREERHKPERVVLRREDVRIDSLSNGDNTETP